MIRRHALAHVGAARFLFLIAFFHRPATGAIVGLLPATYLYAYLAA